MSSEKKPQPVARLHVEARYTTDEFGRPMTYAIVGPDPDGDYVYYPDHEATIEALRAERERLALAICGGEDAPGYANAQSVETLEKVARENAQATMQEIDRAAAAEAALARVEMHRELIENLRHMAYLEPEPARSAISLEAADALEGGVTVTDAMVEAYKTAYGEYVKKWLQNELTDPTFDATRAALEAALSAPAQRVEEGWKLVPVEPTEAMLDAYWEQTGESREMRSRTHAYMRRYYSAMLAASSPPAPHAGVDACNTEQACVAFSKEHGSFMTEFHAGMDTHSADRFRSAMRAALRAALGDRT